MTITKLLAEHWPAVKTIYEEGIATGNATFQTEAPEWTVWDQTHLPSIAGSSHCPPQHQPPPRAAPNLIIRCAGEASTRSKPRPGLGRPITSLYQDITRKVYAGVAEVSVYASPPGQRNKKLGAKRC